MQKDYTHLIIVLDASGSMSSIQDDIKGSFNEFLKKQREAEGQTVFDLFQFNDEVHRLVRSTNLAQFHDDLMDRYECSGCTALNDAVCIAIDTVGHEFADMEEEHHEDGLWEFRLGSGQETDTEGADSGDRHQEVLVESLALHDTLPSFVQRLVTY